jgi:DNA-binding NarL/FixJ family response regulator
VAHEAEHRPIRLLLVDDHEMVIEGLTAMLRSHGRDVEVVAATTDPKEGGRLAVELEPDIALVDVRMRSASGFELCADLVQAVPTMKVVILSVYEDEQYVFRALEAGASGYLTKHITGGELVEQLQRVMAGDVVVSPSLVGRVAVSASRMAKGEFWPGARLGLSQRESEVLFLLVQGASNRVIANRLTLGEETVKTHVSSILRKLNVAHRTEAVAFALREGIFV